MLRVQNIIQKLIPATYSFPSQEGKLFFTFDDGPDPMVTPEVLRLLEKYNALATFFCLGKNVEEYPGLYKEIVSENHSVGNHGYLHLSGWSTAKSTYLKNVEKATEFIESNLFRPPYGRIGLRQFYDLKKKYKIIFWDVMSNDFSQKMSGKLCAQRVLKYARPGSIVVFHDAQYAKENMLYSLELLLEHYSGKGLMFEKL